VHADMHSCIETVKTDVPTNYVDIGELRAIVLITCN
jgi:hypothetical protein